MNYTLWFYEPNNEMIGTKMIKKYDVFTGTRYQCYKLKSQKSFSWQYKVLKAIW
jgi:hypothetical protein